MGEGAIAYVALGSNLDEPRAQVASAFEALAGLPHTTLRARSGLYRTRPWGVLDQPDFVNAVARLATSLPPPALLEALHALERRAGRVRGRRYGPRTLDLDILLYGACALHETGLDIPHPRMHERAFVLLPLSDLAPDLEIPGHGRVADLLARVDTDGCVLLPS